MERGYIKFWRKSLESSVWDNPDLWRFWTYCLLKATWKPRKATIGFQEIELQPGQFVFGRKSAARETSLSEQTIRTCIKVLTNKTTNISEDKKQNGKKLTIKTTNKFSIITIINWDTYQNDERQDNQQTNQQVTNKQPTSNQQLTTNKKLKNSKKEKNSKKTTYSGDIQIVLDYLNDKKGSAYKDGSNILARLNAGGSVEDCLKIIDNKFKDPYFVDNPQHLNPVTLFRKSHWDKYLNDNGNKPIRIYSETTQNNLDVLREASDERRKNVQ